MAASIGLDVLLAVDHLLAVGLPLQVDVLLQVDLLVSRYNYVVALALLGIGLYTMIESPNLVKKVVGMNLFQTAIFLIFITAAYRAEGNPPLLSGPEPYVSPLPHVLILTAIVVGVSLTAVALALVVRIYAEYGTLDEPTLRRLQQ